MHHFPVFEKINNTQLRSSTRNLAKFYIWNYLGLMLNSLNKVEKIPGAILLLVLFFLHHSSHNFIFVITLYSAHLTL